jgi:hypothetical protein
MEGCIAIIAIFGGCIILGLLIAIMRGWVLTYLWQWFIVPFGLPEISILHAWGFAILIGMLTSPVNLKEDTQKTDLNKTIIALIAPLISLGVGYLIHINM